jgi:hypothetical protein
VERFFEGLPGVFAEWEAEAARAYYRTFFPGYRIEPSTRERLAGLLSCRDLGPMLRRLLIETDHDLERALACRAAAEAAGPVTGR